MPWDNQSRWWWLEGRQWRPLGPGAAQYRRRRRGPNPPDLEELLRRSQDRLKSVLPGGGGRKMNPLTIIAILAVVGGARLPTTSSPSGCSRTRSASCCASATTTVRRQPGLNFRLPYPIETVYTPQVTRVNRVTIGQFGDDTTTSGRDIPEESLMLTGDENIVDIDFSVFWVINDARQLPVQHGGPRRHR